MSLYLLEPETPGPGWEPFAGVRPIAELRAGAWRIRERWEGALRMDAAGILGGPAEGFAELDEPPTRPLGPVEGPAVVALSTFAPSGTAPEVEPGVRRLEHEGETVAWIVERGETWSAPHAEGKATPIDGIMLHGSYDLLTALEHFLAADCADFLAAGDHDAIPEGSIILGDPADVIIRGAMVEPGVVFDVRHGAIVLEAGVETRHGTRLEGPLYAGAHSRLVGGFIRASVFGPFCVARGEISNSVFTGYANKAHDGFVGHSVLGHWVNLGAGTTTSNLKNTYGEVRLSVGTGTIPTGRTFLGGERSWEA
jgi:UDP-N-acetylglucosamine diphosphorylase / glucose-1-phosphate thymidylyltransferase / UDP-N-acetylgalactosamine diphosphorylase / glucosamine-1-phosphate N-acetyltransferase / galactosamine-1-phosphate N-acetyltransferase